MIRSAYISECGKYRYSLERTWGQNGLNYCAFIGLNPSTADAEIDDPTIRRCIGFAKDWGFDALCMVNLFAFRATNPKDMLTVADPIGPDNDRSLRIACQNAKLIVAAWGNHGSLNGRSKEVQEDMRGGLHVLGLTKSGEPAHPLYLPKNLKPYLWSGEQIQ
jgi:hypothetical protein